MINKEYMKRLIIQSGLECTDEFVEKLDLYATLLVEWNEKMNLTAITEPNDICVKHFLDSLLPFTIIEFEQGAKVIDVGTGAGLPGVVMKLYRPDIELTLLDSLGKRVKFLEHLCEKLGIEAKYIHSRAEDGARCTKECNNDENMPLRESFDVAIARAVAGLPVLFEYLLPYVKVGGKLLALKGKAVYDEVKASGQACRLLGGERAQLIDYTLSAGNCGKHDAQNPTQDNDRVLVLVQKISHTPTKYPRNSAQIAKKPL